MQDHGNDDFSLRSLDHPFKSGVLSRGSTNGFKHNDDIAKQCWQTEDLFIENTNREEKLHPNQDQTHELSQAVL